MNDRVPRPDRERGGEPPKGKVRDLNRSGNGLDPGQQFPLLGVELFGTEKASVFQMAEALDH
jgi:hypothetical protein